MARWVADEGVTLVFEPARMNRPGKGYGFRFIDPENRLIEVSSGVSALPELPTASHVPTRLAHVALNTTDIDATVDWYARVLGLRISDRSDDAMAFLHTRSDQLVIAFNQAEWAAPNHVAFEVSGMDAFQRHLTRLAAAGHDASWGPGRHSSMNNAFSYYVDPAGLVPEVTFDSSKIAEQAQMPHDGHRAAEPAEVLPAGGAPAPVMVKKLAGVPDPGWA